MDNPRSSKSYDIVSAAVLLAILFIFITIFIYISKQSAEIEAVPEQAGSAEISEQELQRQVADALALGTTEACEAIADEQYRTVCSSNLAWSEVQASYDIARCADVAESVMPRAMCERYVVDVVSVQQQDVSACSQASDEAVRAQCRDSFSLRLAKSAGDAALCGDDAVCMDTYYAQQFAQVAPATWDCSLLTSAEAQADCSAVQTALSSATLDMQALTTSCTGQQTDYFTQICTAFVGSINSEATQ